MGIKEIWDIVERFSNMTIGNVFFLLLGFLLAYLYKRSHVRLFFRDAQIRIEPGQIWISSFGIRNEAIVEEFQFLARAFRLKIRPHRIVTRV